MNVQPQKKIDQEKTTAPTGQFLFTTPVKKVKRFHQVAEWKQSEGFADVYGFILTINEKIKGKKINSTFSKSTAIQKILEMLTRFKALLKDIPPLKQAMRFGNIAFRTWHSQAGKDANTMLRTLLPPELVKAGACEEVCVYLMDSFGSLQRIDYGTGHELNFVSWLATLYKLGVLKPDDILAMVFDVFVSYLDLMRELQTTYWLEPAGSKGVWGLDDYQFLPFLWGTSQLNGNIDNIEPSSIHDINILDQHAGNYLYLAAIKFIKKVKKGGHFYETSPLLNDISQFPTWSRCNSHLIKMYDKEVFSKFPVVQHFYFGSILSFTVCPDTHPLKQAQKRKQGNRKNAIRARRQTNNISNSKTTPTITISATTTTTATTMTTRATSISTATTTTTATTMITRATSISTISAISTTKKLITSPTNQTESEEANGDKTGSWYDTWYAQHFGSLK